MAKFSACYQLCPLIDQKSFLGVTDESTNGCVIITLGKNMVIRYKLSDQKQVNSWSSKDKLSAPVVYDNVNERYIAVFNANQISMWEASCVQLNNLKKFKFATSIDRVLTSPSSTTPVVVFRNGLISPLEEALKKRKDPFVKNPPLIKGEVISDAHLISLLGSVVVALFTIKPENEHQLHLIPLEEGMLAQSCVLLKRKVVGNVLLTGQTLTSHETCYLLTLCALLFIYNTQLCVSQCKQYFKLYTKPAQLWAAGNSAVLLAAGHYLAVVPYYLGKQRLAALVGSQEGDAAPATIMEWGEQYIKDEIEVKEEQSTDRPTPHLQKLIKMYMEEGMSQRMISQSLFLPTLDSSDVEGLACLLNTLTDIPESCIVSVISFCLKDLEREGYRDLLHAALQLPFVPDLNTLKLLRNKLGLTCVLKLLKEISEAMLNTPGDHQLAEWATLLLDAHYQQYLLSRDKVVIETLTGLKTIIDKQIEDMEVWQELEPLLLQMHNGQGMTDTVHFNHNSYSIDQIKLY